MPGAAIGALLGFAFSGALAGAGIFSIFGIGIGTLWLVGASIGSLFDAPSLDLGNTTPNYSFGQLSNTKSQLLPIPIVYGRCRVGGNIFMQTFYDDSLQKMDMFVGVSEGPVQSIKSVYANDVVLIDENGDVVHELDESSLNIHLGTPDQAADSREPTGSTYANVAYVGLTLKAQDGLSGNPVISSIVEGRKVWTPSGTVFSRNPAWIVYDFLTNTRYGVGIPTEYIDLDSFTAAATYCDAPVDGAPRFTLDYIIDTQRPAVDHLQAMLGCFRGFFLARDKIELHVEQAGSVYKELTEDNFVKGTFSWWQKSRDDSPNRIVIEWIDPNNHYEQSSAPFEIQEDIQARGVFEKSISLLGVTRPGQVGRLGNYLLETAKRVQNFCAFQVSTQDADIEAGEIIAITYPDFTGWSAKPFRVLKVQDEGQTGNVTVTCAEYDAAIYADEALTVELPVIETPPVTTDDVYSLALEDVGFLNDGTWVPVIRASWQNPGDYTPTALNVRWRYSGETDWNLSLNSTRLITQARIEGLKSGETVEVWVNCVRPDTGKETTGKTTSMVVGKDVTPPEACTGLAATGWFGSIILEWTNPADKDLNYVELWENAVDNRAGAVKIADVKGAGFTRYLGSFQGRYYWVRGVDLSGNIGPWNAETGVYGNSDQENHQDFVDLLLEENPYLQEAIDDLNTRIDPIEFEMPQIEKIPSIEVDLGTIKDVTVPALRAEVKDIQNIDLPLIEANLTQIEEVDLPGAVQRLAERMKEIDADVMAQLRSVSASAVDALLNIAEIGQRITDAGIVVDPDNGEVRIWAVDQLRTEHGVRLSSAEQLISAQEGIISQKVGIADVDARIEQAVFGNVGELLVSGLESHITSVEQTLDAAIGELAQKATVVEVDAIGGRVGTAESKISGLEASVALKATQTEVDELDSRITTAEITVDALNGTIGSEIIAIGQEGRDLANLTAEGLVEAILNDSENHDRAKIQLATAQTEIYARVEEGLSAEAGQRTALAATVAGNTAAIIAEATTRSDQDSALAQSITALQAETEADIGTVTAAIQSEATARTSADGALAGQITALETTVSTQDTTLRGLITAEASARSTADGVIVGQVSALEATVEGNDTAVRGLIVTESEARADEDEALAGQITTLAATVGGNTAAIQTESQVRSDADAALAGQITTLQSTVGANTGAIQTEAETRADADTAISRQSLNLLAKVEPVAEGLVEDILNQADARKNAFEQYANIRQDYSVKIEAGISSEATARELLAAKLGEAESAILTESVVRSTQDTALASQITTLAATVGANTGAIQTEAIVRADADSAMAGQITTLGSTVAGNTAAIQTEAQTRADADEALAGEISVMRADVGDNTAAIQNESSVRADADTALARFSRNMQAVVEPVAEGLVEDVLNQADARKNAVEQYAAIREDYEVKIEAGISSEASKRELLAVKLGEAEAAILTESVTRATQDSALASEIVTLEAEVGENRGAIQTEAQARADADGAISGQITTLTATVGTNTSAIQTEATARADADSAMASQITTLISDVGDNTAAIQTEQTARANADSALASTISTVSATANAKNKTYRQASAPTTGMTAGDLWFDSDDNNKSYRYSGSAWVATDDTRIAQNTADIQTEQIARADGDSAVASQVTTLQTTTVGGDVTESATAPANPTTGQSYYNTTSKKYFRWNGTAWVEIKGIEGHSRSAIQIINESVDGIKGKHAVKIDTNGYVTGYELIGGPDNGSMVFHVDNFLIGKPGTTTDYPFALGTVDGVTRLSLKNAWIQDAAIKNSNIDNLTIGRIKLASGATAGLSWGDSTFASTVVAYTADGVHTPAGASVQIRTESRGRVMVSAYMRAQHWHSTLNMGLYRNGVKILDLGGSGGGAYDPATPIMCFWVDKSPPDSSNTAYSIRVQKIYGEAVYVYQRGISVTAIYR